ncbi:MAG: hypothetical protein AABN95_24680 [Acidobacteriota bacterium]
MRPWVALNVGINQVLVQNRARWRLVKKSSKSLSLKGCQKVAGGRSVAQTTGKQAKEFSTLERLSGKLPHAAQNDD